MESINVILAKEWDQGMVVPQRYCAISSKGIEQMEVYDYFPDLLAFSLREDGIEPTNVRSYEVGEKIQGNWSEVSDKEIQEFKDNLKLWPYLTHKTKRPFKNLYNRLTR